MAMAQNDDGLSSANFQKVATFIQETYGIKMPPSKKTMVDSRLQKRKRQTGHGSINDYVDFLFSAEGQRLEVSHAVDAISTNKTEFFREANHFDTLTDKVLPLVLQEKKAGQVVRVWSAACSSGEEPYTLAMVLQEYRDRHPALRFAVEASDINMQVLQQARRGRYSEERIHEIPPPLRKKYLLRSKNHVPRLVQFKPDLQKKVSFRRINLMEGGFGLAEKVDIIFCRNVLIYFSRENQRGLMARFAKQLTPGGFLFIGHSESLNNMDVPFNHFLPTVYRRKEGV